MPDVNLVSINTWKGDGAYFERLNVLERQLKELTPGIIACQECFHIADSDISTIEYLSRALRMNSVFTPARRKKRLFKNTEIDTLSGLGVLSPYPLRIVEEIVFPYAPGDGERKIQFVEINITPDVRLLLCNVHLTHLRSVEGLKQQQVDFLAALLKSHTQYPHRIICGDLNMESDEPEFLSLCSQLNARDAYVAGDGRYPRINQKNNFQVEKDLDHILLLPDDTGKYITVTNSRMALHQPDDFYRIFASDHPAIVTTLHL